MKRQLADVMIAAKNYQGLVKFYETFMKFDVVLRGKEFSLVRDQVTKQTLCITNGTVLSKPGASIETDDLGQTIEDLLSAGGKLRKRWEYPALKGAVCEDPDGNELMIWQGDRQATFG